MELLLVLTALASLVSGFFLVRKCQRLQAGFDHWKRTSELYELERNELQAKVEALEYDSEPFIPKKYHYRVHAVADNTGVQESLNEGYEIGSNKLSPYFIIFKKEVTE